MNEKILLSQLLADFAKHSSLPKTTQRTFVQQFFALIASALVDEGLVKVKGLGTFKLIEVAGRRSVDVNTGTPIEIERHTKVSFTPDSEMKAKVNKPFDQFQTVLINEETDLRLMENIPEAEISPEPIPEKPTERPMPPKVAKGAESPADTSAPLPATPDNHSVTAEECEPVREEPSPATEVETEEPSMPGTETNKKEYEPSPHRSWWHLPVTLVLVFVLMSLSYWAGYRRMFIPPTIASAKEQAAPLKQTPKRAEPVSTQPKHQPAVQKEQPAPAQQVSRTKHDATFAAQYPPHESDKYRIVGEKSQTILEKGASLNLISLRTYGSKQYVKYIIRFNHFDNPDNLPVGTKVKLPELERIP